MYSIDSSYSVPVGKRSTAISLSVFLSVRAHISRTAGLIVTNFVCRFPVVVARSSSGGVAMCYVLPVLWMMLRLAVVDRMVIRIEMHVAATTASDVAIPGRSLMFSDVLISTKFNSRTNKLSQNCRVLHKVAPRDLKHN